MTAVMRHLRKHRPEWTIDYQADAGRESAMIGLVRNVYAYQENIGPTNIIGTSWANPTAPIMNDLAAIYQDIKRIGQRADLYLSDYDNVIEIKLYDTFAAWTDRPNTRVTSCLHEKFGMGWDLECGGYQINIQKEPEELAGCFLSPLLSSRGCGRENKVVAVHYLGDSSPAKKNLTHEQAAEVCKHIKQLGRVPLLLDWRNTSPLPDGCTVHTTGRLVCSNSWGRSAQINTALIDQCEAFIGIDSGPGKCASSTNTPTLIVWTGHHPALYHDPADNTMHLVPIDHERIEPVNGNKDVIRFFLENYNVRTYLDYHVKTHSDDLVSEVKKWLSEKLK